MDDPLAHTREVCFREPQDILWPADEERQGSRGSSSHTWDDAMFMLVLRPYAVE